MDWNDVRYVLALARHGSVRGAGASLGVSHSTVARRVEALEGDLGVRLFDRHRDGYTLTDAGRELMPRAEEVEKQMAALQREIEGRDARLSGRVRVTCCDPWIADMVLEACGALAARHEGIELELGVDSRPFDLSKREADIAIRAKGVGDAPAPHLIGRKLVPITIASYVAASRREHLDPAFEGVDARLLGYDDDKMMATMVASSSYPDLPLWGRFGTLTTMVQAARQGLGVAMLPTYAADRDPSLVRIEVADVRHVGDIWLLSHPDLRHNARLRAARSCMATALTERSALFAGAAVASWTELAEGRSTRATTRRGDAPHGPAPSHVGIDAGAMRRREITTEPSA